MKYEKSAGAIVFREKVRSDKGEVKREYLVLARPGRGEKKRMVWDFPKGLSESEALERETAEREVREETGLSEFSFIEGFRENIRVLYKWEGEFHTKTIIFFLAQATSDDVRISFEHQAFEWLTLEEALERLSFKNTREILKKADDFLKTGVSDPPMSLGI